MKKHFFKRIGSHSYGGTHPTIDTPVEQARGPGKRCTWRQRASVGRIPPPSQNQSVSQALTWFDKACSYQRGQYALPVIELLISLLENTEEYLAKYLDIIAKPS